MRPHFSSLVSLLALLLAACPSGENVVVTLENTGSETRWVSGYSQPQITVEQQVGGAYRWTGTSAAMLCIQQCSQPGAVVCADVAPPDTAYALLAGDAYTFELELPRWVEVSGPAGDCARKTSLEGDVRFTVCHGSAASSDEQDFVQPAQSGPAEGSGFFVELEDRVCEEFEFDLSGERGVTLSIGG